MSLNRLNNGYVHSLLLLLALSLICELKLTSVLLAIFSWGLAALALSRLGVPLSRLTGAATAKSLAWIRIVTASVLLVHYLLEDVPSLAALSPDIARYWGVGITRPIYRLPFYKSFIDDAVALRFLSSASILALFTSAIGIYTRASLPIATVLTFLLGGIHRDFTHVFHTGLLPWYVLLALCFTPCGDAWSYDDLFRKRRGQPRPDPDQLTISYGAYCFACWAVVALTYVASALSKLRRTGTEWPSAVNLRTFSFQDSLNLIEWFDLDVALHFVDAPDALFIAMGLGGLFFELVPAFVLVSHHARKVVPFLVMGLHIGILVFQGFLFLDAVLFQVLFLDPTRIRKSSAELEAPEAAMPRGPKYLVAAVFLTASLVWTFNVERYPFTAWGMYAYLATSHRLDYQKVYYLTASGERVRTDLSEVIPALSQGRFLDQINVFSGKPNEIHRTNRFFDECAAVFNRERSGPDKVVAFEVEHWRWRFYGNGKEPLPGTRVNVYRREVRQVPR